VRETEHLSPALETKPAQRVFDVSSAENSLKKKKDK
jgi:hypothetical protein